MASIPAISIITPVRNGLPYIKECVESVLMQDFQNWEMVISDNCSTDGTRDYLTTLTDKRIKVFIQEENLGIFGNLNYLFSQLSAPKAYILCADDYFYEEGLSQAINEWEQLTEKVAFIRFNWKTTIKGKRLTSYSYKILPKILHPPVTSLAFFLFGNLSGNLSNLMVDVSTVKMLGGFSESLPYSGDFEMWYRIARNNSFMLSTLKTVFIRRHELTASIYLNKKGELYPQNVIIYEEIINDLSINFNKRELMTFFNIEICSSHYRNGINSLRKGNFEYINKFATTKSNIFWPKFIQLIGCLPFALSESLRQKITTRIAEKMFANLVKK